MRVATSVVAIVVGAVIVGLTSHRPTAVSADGGLSGSEGKRYTYQQRVKHRWVVDGQVVGEVVQNCFNTVSAGGQLYGDSHYIQVIVNNCLDELCPWSPTTVDGETVCVSGEFLSLSGH
jgi:hypothetical protein